jgi:hypothetical protein
VDVIPYQAQNLIGKGFPAHFAETDVNIKRGIADFGVFSRHSR